MWVLDLLSSFCFYLYVSTSIVEDRTHLPLLCPLSVYTLPPTISNAIDIPGRMVDFILDSVYKTTEYVMAFE